MVRHLIVRVRWALTESNDQLPLSGRIEKRILELGLKTKKILIMEIINLYESMSLSPWGRDGVGLL